MEAIHSRAAGQKRGPEPGASFQRGCGPESTSYLRWYVGVCSSCACV